MSLPDIDPAPNPEPPPSDPHPLAVLIAVASGAFLMVATLPGRTQGLGLITEPLLAEFNLSRDSYAQINLWATLLGSLACLPVGLWASRTGLRPVALALLGALAAVVALMSRWPHPGWWGLFFMILLTRALGQSGLSVLSISAAGATFRGGRGAAAASYAVLLSVLFAVSFAIVGAVVRESGWRAAWGGIAIFLLLLLPIALLLRGKPRHKDDSATGAAGDFTLAQCLRQPLFWAFALGIALFTAISSGTSLFGEALLAERGFDQRTFHHFQSLSFLIALAGQIVCGAGAKWVPMRFWLGAALIVQAAALIMYGVITDPAGLWTMAALAGLSGGIITVAFFSIWAETFGRRHLVRIMAAAQLSSVFASALGPLLIERGRAALGTHAAALLYLAPAVAVTGVLIICLRVQRFEATFVPASPVHE